MRREGQPEQRRVVEDDEADEEQRGGTTGLPNTRSSREWTSPRTSSRGPRLPSPTGGERAQREADRCREDEEHRRIHRDGHVLDHVPRERDPAEHARGATRRPDEDHPADDPPDQAQDAPVVAPAAQPDHPHQVDADGEDRQDAPEPVEPPQRQPGRGGRRGGRFGVPGQLRRRRRGVEARRRGGRGRAGQCRREPDGHAHDDELGHREPEEQPPDRTLGGHPADHPAALLPAEQAEDDQAGGLDEDQGPVCGGEVPELADRRPAGSRR